jgi:hypothetical protein
MLTTAIIARAKRRYARESLSTTVWEDIVARAVTEYSRWNPVDAVVTLTTVANQSDYTVHANCLVIREVAFDSYATLTAASPDRLLTTNSGVKRTMPSLALIDDINNAEYERQLTPSWSWLPGSKKIRIDPTPGSAGDLIYVQYFALHVATTGDYTTIPAEDLDIVVDLMLYEVYGDRSFDMALEPDYQAGLEKETFGNVQANVQAARDSLLQRVQGKYGGTGGVLWP